MTSPDAEHVQQPPKPRKPRLVLYYTRYACATCGKLCPTVKDVITHHMSKHGVVFTQPGPFIPAATYQELVTEHQKAFI